MHNFGGGWTEVKLDRLKQYLKAYMIILNKHPELTPIYLDAFAGTGSRHEAQPKSEQLHADLEANTSPLKGSARIALETEPSFHHFIFVEQKLEFANELKKLREEFPHKASRIRIEQREANTFIKNWCAETNWQRNRAVVFLDPYGGQVEWSTLEALAKTKAVDLWILFPVGMVVNRLLKGDAQIPKSWADRLTSIFGTEGWKNAFYQSQTVATLFGDEEEILKDADFEKIGQFFVKRLKTIFPTVSSKPLPLRNSKNSPLYMLCFAAANPSPTVAGAALRIANYILTR